MLPGNWQHSMACVDSVHVMQARALPIYDTVAVVDVLVALHKFVNVELHSQGCVYKAYLHVYNPAVGLLLSWR